MKRDHPRLLICDERGKLFDHPTLEATGMKCGRFFRIGPDELIKLPPGSRIFMLPGRAPVGYNPLIKDFVTLGKYIFKNKSERCFAAAAFTPPGFTITYNASFKETGSPGPLPLFSYGACVLYKNDFYVTAVRVDREKRHDTRFIDIVSVKKNIKKVKGILRGNRLVRHLEGCALDHCCPGAQNFFLGRYEGPLPSSPGCNARCCGCISYQSNETCPATQPRIKFIPTPEEISDIALFHMGNVKDPLVSFGQGCDGEPLLVSDVIEKSIILIRKRTKKGIINMNTNGSMPDSLQRLLDAGLNSIRVSLNSVREPYYMRYYKPVNYTFKNVLRSIKIAKTKKAFVSINYLTMPGFTDSKNEFAALENFINAYRIDMIQWRNLNFDPGRYFKELNIPIASSQMLGIREIMNKLKQKFPRLLMGYFNPTLSRMRSSGSGR